MSGATKFGKIVVPQLDEDVTDTFKECVPASPDGSLDDDKDDELINYGSHNSQASWCWAGWTARTLLLDLPLLVIIAVYFGMLWLDHVHDQYLFPQMQAARFDNERRGQEITYYARSCDARDISTINSADLFLPADATADDAYLHQLEHGFTIFRSALSPETAHNLRDYVVSRNPNITEEESIFVIEGANRYSFGLGTEEPSVTAAVMELTNHKQVRESIAKIMGPDPALIEMTAITATYGAVSQYYHDDVYAVASAVRYARTFAPSYSLFIQLQNTSKAMGATAACPGSHYCNEGNTQALCEEQGFQLVNDEGHWAAGDALLMNHNSHHRGGAHTDADALDRVMFILTFTPKPKAAAETRLLSQGITFSIRWNFWAHTWSDLQTADVSMTQPWATLRSLGLYKSPGAAWGVDYITSSSMRMANSDIGFDGEAMVKLLKRGGLRYIPVWLQEPMEDWDDDFMLWHYFLHGTFTRVKNFWTRVTAISPLVYVLVCATIGIIWGHPRLSAWSAARRLVVIYIIFRAIFLVSRRHVDSTQWAKDISANRRFSSSMANEVAFVHPVGYISTFPNRHDVLMENRLGSGYLHMYEDFIPLGHPGNRIYSKMVEATAPFYAVYPNYFRQATAQYIVDAISIENHGRFLNQGYSGTWLVADQKTALHYTTKLLASASNPALGVVLTGIRHAISDYRFGVYRDSVLATKHMVPHLRVLEARLWKDYTTPSSTQTLKSRIQRRVRRQRTRELWSPDGVMLLDYNAPLDKNENAHGPLPMFRPSPPRTIQANENNRVDHSIHISSPSFKLVPTEPEPGAWIRASDRVEGLVDGHWYIGTIIHVTAHGIYFMEYPDGDNGGFRRDQIRPILPYQVGEELEVHLSDFDHDDDDMYRKCIIVSAMENGKCNVYVRELEMYVENVADSDFRRKAQEWETEEGKEYVRKYK